MSNTLIAVSHEIVQSMAPIASPYQSDDLMMESNLEESSLTFLNLIVPNLHIIGTLPGTHATGDPLPRVFHLMTNDYFKHKGAITWPMQTGTQVVERHLVWFNTKSRSVKNKSYTPWREGSDGRQNQYKNKPKMVNI